MLVDFFSSIVDSIMPLVELNKMPLKLDIGENSETEVFIDPYLISRCIENLVLNKIKYRKTQTDITLSIEL